MKDQFHTIKQVILHLIAFYQSESKGISITKLYKLLYFIDFGHYALNQSSITKLNYLKFKYGPVPFGVDTLLKSMEENGLLNKQWISDSYDGHYLFKAEQKDYLKGLDLNEKEQATIEKTARAFLDSSATEASEETHYHYSWLSTDNGKIIAYETAQHCDFPWLGYYNNKSEEEFKEIQNSRNTIKKSPTINKLFDKIQKL
ncbi:MAG: Panacea domain-containing protein [Bacteroidota bacterium]